MTQTEKQDAQIQLDSLQLASALSQEEIDFAKIKEELFKIGDENGRKVLAKLRQIMEDEIQISEVQNPTIAKKANHTEPLEDRNELLSPNSKLISEACEESAIKSPLVHLPQFDQSEEVLIKTETNKANRFVIQKYDLLSFGSLPEGDQITAPLKMAKREQEHQPSIAEIEFSLGGQTTVGDIAEIYLRLISELLSVNQSLQNCVDNGKATNQPSKKDATISESNVGKAQTDEFLNPRDAVLNPMAKFIFELSATFGGLFKHLTLAQPSPCLGIEITNEFPNSNDQLDLTLLHKAVVSYKEALQANLNTLCSQGIVAEDKLNQILANQENQIILISDLIDNIQEKLAGTINVVKQDIEITIPAAINNINDLDQDLQSKAQEQPAGTQELNYSCDFAEDQKIIRLSLPLLKKISKNLNNSNHQLLSAMKQVMESREQQLKSSFEHLEIEHKEAKVQDLVHAVTEIDGVTKDKLLEHVESIFGDFMAQFGDEQKDLAEFFDSVSNMLKNQIGEVFESLRKMHELFQVIERLRSNTNIENVNSHVNLDKQESNQASNDEADNLDIDVEAPPQELADRLSIIGDILLQPSITKKTTEILVKLVRDSLDELIEMLKKSASIEDENKNLSTKVQSLESEYAKSRNSLHEANDKLSETSGHLEKANQQLETQSKIISNLEKETESLSKKSSEKNKEIRHIKSEFDKLSMTNFNLMNEQKNLKSTIYQLEAKISELQTFSDSMSSQAKQTIADLTHQLASRNELIQDQGSRILEITGQNSSLENRNTSLMSELETVNTQLKQQKEISQKLEEKLNGLKKINEAAVVENSQLKKKLTELEPKFIELTKKNLELQTEITTLRRLPGPEAFPTPSNKSNFKKSPREISSDQKNVSLKPDSPSNQQMMSLPDTVLQTLKSLKKLIENLQQHVPGFDHLSELEKHLKEIETKLVVELRLKIISLSKSGPEIPSEFLHEQSISFSEVSNNLNLFSETLSQSPDKVLSVNGRVELLKLISQVYLKSSMTSMSIFNDLPTFLLPLKRYDNPHYLEYTSKLKKFVKVIIMDMTNDMNVLAGMINADIDEFLKTMVSALNLRRSVWKEFMTAFKEEITKAYA